MCVTACTPASGGNSFLLTGASGANNAPANPLTGTGNGLCFYDFLAITGGFNPATGLAADRYCGGALNPIVPGGAPFGTTVCSMLPRFIYKYSYHHIHLYNL
jgi:hypothetical protein